MNLLMEAKNVQKNYDLGTSKVHALIDMNLQIFEGDFLALAGSSGSGKTTLLNLLGGLDVPNSGSIQFKGKDISHYTSDQLAHFRATEVGFVFQTFNLLPVLTALENVEYPLLKTKLSRQQIQRQATQALTQVGLENFLEHTPRQMSGGQRQRVAIARAIVHQPKIIFADEPTANLNKAYANEILDFLQQINQKNQVTIVFSTHDPMVLSRAKRIIHISDGKFIQEERQS
jgi:putative ABC transport system ATP-binding protein